MTDIKRLQRDIVTCYVNGALAHSHARKALTAIGIPKDYAEALLYHAWTGQVLREQQSKAAEEDYSTLTRWG